MPIGARDNFRGVVYICMMPAVLTPEEVYPDKQRAYEQLETGCHWPTREEWFKPRQEPQFEVRRFFAKPPALTSRQRLLYGLDRYPQKPSPCKRMSMVQDDCETDGGSGDKAGSSNDRVRRWNRAKAKPNDSKAETASASSHDSSDSIDVPKDDNDDGFWETSEHPTGVDQAHLGTGSAVSKAREVRRLQKALLEIGRLELQQQVLGGEGQLGLGKLRLNQLQKISKKQEYMDRLQELGASFSASAQN